MLIQKLKPGQIVIIDNASIHKTDMTQKLIEETGCKLIFMLSYSPDLNQIEYFWTELKKKLQYIAHQFETLKDAMNAAFS